MHFHLHITAKYPLCSRMVTAPDGCRCLSCGAFIAPSTHLRLQQQLISKVKPWQLSHHNAAAVGYTQDTHTRREGCGLLQEAEMEVVPKLRSSPENADLGHAGGELDSALNMQSSHETQLIPGPTFPWPHWQAWLLHGDSTSPPGHICNTPTRGVKETLLPPKRCLSC